MKIGVIHPDLTAYGGSESVGMHIIDAFSSTHDITLLTSKWPKLNMLNTELGTSATVEEIVIPKPAYILSSISEYTNNNFNKLKTSLISRYVRKRDEFDLLVSAYNAVGRTEIPTLHYIHVPQFAKGSIPGVKGNGHPLQSVYEGVCKTIGNIKLEQIKRNKFIANSKWTAKMIREAYDIEASVVYPPVKVPERNVDFKNKEYGFVSVGRISPDKNILESVEVIKQVRERGYPVHMHLIGRVGNEEYGNKVKSKIKGHEWIKIEGEVKRERLEKLISNHKYGIHMKEFEHFGISVAEMAAAGTIPFIPQSGGQKEIVDNICTFSSPSTAVETIINIIAADEDQQAKLSQNLIDNIEVKKNTFKNEIREEAKSII